MVTIINATVHALNVKDINGEVKTILPSGINPRVEECKLCSSHLVDEKLCEFRVDHMNSGKVHGLPEQEESKVYVVSRAVAIVLKGERKDIYVPGEFIRDDKGNIIGCDGLVCL